MLKAGFGMVSNFFSYAVAVDEPAPPVKSDALFVFGDMNFRVTLPFLESMRIINGIKQQKLFGETLEKEMERLLAADQLGKALKEVRTLRMLKEKKLAFMPTYKLEETQDLYARDKERTPSWTDRILTFAREGFRITSHEYSSLPKVLNSDHRYPRLTRPVYLLAQVHLEPLKTSL